MRTQVPDIGATRASNLKFGLDFALQPSPDWLVAGTCHPNLIGGRDPVATACRESRLGRRGFAYLRLILQDN
jgi:hypothetical protein